MSEERKSTREEIEAHIIKRIEDFVSDYANIMKYCEIFENMPMTERERRQYDNTISSFRDSLMLERYTFEKAFGKNIHEALDKAFENLFEAGERQGSVIAARKMKAKGYDVKDIAEITGLTAKEIEAL
jgi:predicted transposase/invertase (TIGR01784 family)